MLKLGIDTGGTYTDSVLFDSQSGILNTFKSITTHHDLNIGISKCIDGLLDSAESAVIKDLTQVCLSTTLATNAIVENRGLSTCLILIGYEPKILTRANLNEAIKDDPVVFVDGGHNAQGLPLKTLDEDKIAEVVDKYKGSVHSFAIASYFSVRNPEHEKKAQQIISSLTSKPVTCSHEISSSLDSPKRTLTTLFNARLIPLLANLISAIENKLKSLNVDVPIMIVQGDGSIVNAEQAMSRPIETILSGPAASIHGARYLAKCDSGIVSDIGGTTTDIAIIENGLPSVNQKGARVGHWHTMVEAVNIYTFGIGGDSEVLLLENGVIDLSTRRAIPISLLCSEYPECHKVLDRQLDDVFRTYNGIFIFINRKINTQELFKSSAEKDVYNLLLEHKDSSGNTLPMPLTELMKNPSNEKAIYRLRERGIVNLSTFTPSDASHALENNSHWDNEAARKAAQIICNKITNHYKIDIDVSNLCKQVIEKLTFNTCHALTQSTIDNHYDTDPNIKPNQSPSKSITKNARSNFILNETFNAKQSIPHIEFQTKLNLPIIAIGASADTYYPQIANRLNTEAIVPAHADVCNAVGAVTAQILRKATILITCPEDDKFAVHSPTEHKVFLELEKAESYAREQAKCIAEQLATEAGATEMKTDINEYEKSIWLSDNHKLLLEKKFIACTVGNPL